MSDKKVPEGRSYNVLQKSLDNLQSQQVGGVPPVLYPQINLSDQQSAGVSSTNVSSPEAGSSNEGGQE